MHVPQAETVQPISRSHRSSRRGHDRDVYSRCYESATLHHSGRFSRSDRRGQELFRPIQFSRLGIGETKTTKALTSALFFRSGYFCLCCICRIPWDLLSLVFPTQWMFSRSPWNNNDPYMSQFGSIHVPITSRPPTNRYGCRWASIKLYVHHMSAGLLTLGGQVNPEGPGSVR